MNLGLIPGFGGTQPLPRLVAEAKALEMNLTGDPIDGTRRTGSGSRSRWCWIELFYAAIAWARNSRASPRSRSRRSRSASHARLDAGFVSEAEGFYLAFGLEDAKEGIAAFPGKRQAKFQGK